jgi:hypothetical protein
MGGSDLDFFGCELLNPVVACWSFYVVVKLVCDSAVMYRVTDGNRTFLKWLV